MTQSDHVLANHYNMIRALENQYVELSNAVTRLESAMSKPHTVLAPAIRTPPFQFPDDLIESRPPADAGNGDDITADVIAHPERWQMRDGRKVASASTLHDGHEYPLVVTLDDGTSVPLWEDGRFFLPPRNDARDLIHTAPSPPPAEYALSDGVVEIPAAPPPAGEQASPAVLLEIDNR